MSLTFPTRSLFLRSMHRFGGYVWGLGGGGGEKGRWNSGGDGGGVVEALPR